MTLDDPNHMEPLVTGEFAPGVHGGAEAMVLADAADTWRCLRVDVDVSKIAQECTVHICIPLSIFITFCPFSRSKLIQGVSGKTCLEFQCHAQED